MGADYFMNPPVREKAKERASEAIKKLVNDTWRDVNGCDNDRQLYAVCLCLTSLIEAIGIAVSVLEEKP